MSNLSNDPLDYLKTLAACAEEQREMERKRISHMLKVIPLLVVCGVFVYWIGQSKDAVPTVPNWSEVESSARNGELARALELADTLLAKNPQYFEGHYKKGEILLMLGDKDGAKKSFQAAYDLFPIPKYKQAVEAFQKPKAIAAKPGQPPVPVPASQAR